ncbi:MAG: YcaO-like family protein [Coleofasciculus sp. F4-SAH-05]
MTVNGGIVVKHLGVHKLQLHFSQAQYDSRQDWNAKTKALMRKVPEPFDETEEIDWTPVWSLTDQDWKYLPTAYCYFNYPKSSKPYCWADSNGCASGNSLEEAILHGFMELVERDSIALWWYNRLSKPTVDLDSFDEPYFQGLQEYHQKLQRKLWVLDITSDLNIPTFAAISQRTDREIEDIVLGFGSHFDAKIAVSRALTEANQILPSVLHLAADGSTLYSPSINPVAVDCWKTATAENQPYLVPDRSAVAKRYSDYPQVWSNNLLDDIMACQQIVENKGMKMLVLDQTRPDIGLRVVRVIVPGMRHYWKRLGSGRLYDVPVQMNWLPAPLEESQLNPISMWM